MSVGSHRFAGQSAQQQTQALDRARAEVLARRRRGWAIARGARVEPPGGHEFAELRAWLEMHPVGERSDLVGVSAGLAVRLLAVVDAAVAHVEQRRAAAGPSQWPWLLESVAPFRVAPAVDVDEPGGQAVDGAECRALSPDGVGPACSCSGSVCALGFERCEPAGRVFNERMQAEDRRRGRAALGIVSDGRSPLAVRLLVEAD